MTTTSSLHAETATAAEIRQQPEAWRNLVDTLAQRRADLDAFLAFALGDDTTRIVLTGAGTSAFVGDIAAEFLRRRLGRRVDSIATTDIVADPQSVFAEGGPLLVVSFARSGNSPESVAATRIAEDFAASAHHLVITCDPEGALAVEHRKRPNSFVLDMPAETNDTGFAMTSSFSTMLLASLLSFAPSEIDAVDVLTDAATRLIDDADQIGELVNGADRVVYLGSGALGGLARESALKLLELTAGGIVSFYDTALGFRHGPKAVVNAKTLAVVYVSAEPYTTLYDADILTELRASAAATVVAVGGQNDGGAAFPLELLDPYDDALRAVALIVFAQLLGLSASLQHGCTPDNPFPAGSVNRIVQGVTIHTHEVEASAL
jgi:tagatose-6-phosphate ketose/aldose isomerase